MLDRKNFYLIDELASNTAKNKIFRTEKALNL